MGTCAGKTCKLLIRFNLDDGTLRGAADPRRDGKAAAY